ncbi:MAG: FAD-binding protein [Candidatus Aenigmarchaeota archaeon]|nr:FAD-binding protein [Candidatus Aenigmarchaeota archaeon]
MLVYDVIIIGGGPAGLTAGIYAIRRTLKTLIISEEFGGVPVNVPLIENYPGFKKIHGMELMKKMEEQTKDMGVEIVYGESARKIIEKKGKFMIKTEENDYEAKAIILAFGRSPRHLNVPGEDKFENKGISYCVNCDGPLFKDEVVCVVGGGNAALDAALVMSEIGKKVYVIHRRDEFRGFEAFVNKIKNKDNVEFVLDSVVKEFKGDKMLKSVVVENVKSKETKELEVAGAFIEIGSVVESDFVKGLVKVNKSRLVVVNDNCQTFHPNSDKVRPGIFAAGDVTDNPFKQIVVATGQGAIAALQSYNYIQGRDGGLYADWGHKKEK